MSRASRRFANQALAVCATVAVFGYLLDATGACNPLYRSAASSAMSNADPDSIGGQFQERQRRIANRYGTDAPAAQPAAKAKGKAEDFRAIGAYYPDADTTASSSSSADTSMLLPIAGAAVGGLGVFGVAGLGVWMLMGGRKEDEPIGEPVDGLEDESFELT